MKKYNIILVLAVLLSCGTEQNTKKPDNRPAQIIWEFSENMELFAEYPVLVMGQESRFAAHINSLTDFKPYENGELTAILKNRDYVYEHSVNTSNPVGIFRPVLKPEEAGVYDLLFTFKTKHFTDTILVKNIRVYEDAHLSIAGLRKIEESHDEISFLKEQAWNGEFATVKLRPSGFNEILKVSGEIKSSQSDETTISAKSSGIIVFSRNNIVPGAPVYAGNELFIISGANLAFDNIESQFASAKIKFENSKLNYERALKLTKTKAISDKEFIEYRTVFQNDSIIYFNLAKNISQSGVKIKSTLSGFIQNLYVSEGQYVEAGKALATVSKNRKLIVKADVPLHYHQSVGRLESANFTLPYNNKTFSLEELNGTLLSVGKSAKENYFIPVYFEVLNNGQFIDGSYIDVYLKSKRFKNQIVVPKSAVIEEQGKYFVYVQTGGESFEKRYINTKAYDGYSYLVSDGVDFDERVVTQGAYYIKLSSMSGTLPVHGHTH